MNYQLSKKNPGDSTVAVGKKGEEIAEGILKEKGYEIIKRNFHFGRYGEIDIIAKDKDTLVFVEVKTRYSKEYGNPLESITYSKQMKLKKAAEGYLYINNIRNVPCRIDVIAIDFTEAKPIIEHLVNAF
jgi:putative endonuclease